MASLIPSKISQKKTSLGNERRSGWDLEDFVCYPIGNREELRKVE